MLRALKELPRSINVNIVNTSTVTVDGSARRLYRIQLLVSFDPGRLPGNNSIGLKAKL